MKLSTFLIVTANALVLLATQAHASGKEIIGYVVDSSGNIVHDNYGGCVKTTRWKPEHAIAGCDEVKKKKEADSDGDGIVDSRDKCPGTPKGAKVDSKGCQLDSDGDGVVDGNDRCPGTAAGIPVDAKGCSRDSDGDGVIDANDQCPGTAAGTKVDNKGCKLKAKIELRGVNFASGSAKLTADSSATLDDMAITLKRYPELKVEVGGHTDSSGSHKFNTRLSQRRAESVRDYLVAQGVAANRLTAKGYGPDVPVASNATRDGRAKNRRVELTLK